MKAHIAVLAGDGIGPGIMASALKVLAAVEQKFSHSFTLSEALVGGAAFEAYGKHLPQETLDVCHSADAVLFAAVGGPVAEQHLEKWRNCEVNSILALRKALSLNVSLRPVRIFKSLCKHSPLREDIVAKGVDILFVRELAADIYFGARQRYVKDGERFAEDTAIYSETQIREAALLAFKAAKSRRGILHSVDKANVLDTSRLWREVVRELAKDFPEVKLQEILVDNCAMQIVLNPAQFDVVLASNMFGDILSDAGAVLPGSLGVLASASFGKNGTALYEPPGGSAPDIAGKGIANPLGQILCVAMMLRHSFSLEQEAALIEQAVEQALEKGLRTKDLAEPSGPFVSTREMTEAVVNCILDKS